MDWKVYGIFYDSQFEDKISIYLRIRRNRVLIRIENKIF